MLEEKKRAYFGTDFCIRFIIHSLCTVRFGVGNEASSLRGMHFSKSFPMRGCLYLTRTDSSA